MDTERAKRLENADQMARATLDWHSRKGEPTEGPELVAFDLAGAVVELLALVESQQRIVEAAELFAGAITDGEAASIGVLQSLRRLRAALAALVVEGE